MVPSGFCFCQRRTGAPRPTSITSRTPAASIKVLLPKRSGDGIGLPVPSSVTIMLPSPPPAPVVCPPQPLMPAAPASFAPELPAAPPPVPLASHAGDSAPSAPPLPERPPDLLLHAARTSPAPIAIVQHFAPRPNRMAAHDVR